MGRAPCCDRANVKKGPWSPEEDAKLKEYIKTHGTGGNWIALPQKAGLKRCGKSCRLRWLNYLRPDIKHGDFSDEENRVIINLFTSIGSRWSVIAAQLAGRTDNDIKNYWNTKLKKKFMEIAAASHKTPQHSSNTLSSEKFPILEPSSVISSPAAAATISTFNYYNTPTSPSIFTAYEQNQSFSISSILVNRATCFSNLSSPPSGLETYNQNIHSMNQFQENFMRFGGEASSSSSDGSSSEHDHFGTVSNVLDVDLQGYFCSYQKNYGFYGENPLDYSLEEMKQLISTNLDLQQQHLG